MHSDEPNWGLAFACGSFLLVWCLAAFSGVSYEIMLLRGGVAAILGGGLGVLVGYTLAGLKTLHAGLHDEKGASVDFTIADDGPALPRRGPVEGDGGEPEAREQIVPQAGPAGSFQAVDLKSAAKHVQSLIQE